MSSHLPGHADACLDFRMEPMDFLRIQAGGMFETSFNHDVRKLIAVRVEAFVIRNAGGSVSNNLVDLLFMDKFMQQSLKEIIVIHHDGEQANSSRKRLVSKLLTECFRLWGPT